MEGALTLARWELRRGHGHLGQNTHGKIGLWKEMWRQHCFCYLSELGGSVGYTILGQEVPFEGLLRLLSWEMCVKAMSRRKLDGGRQMVGGMVSAPPQHQDRSFFKVLLESAAKVVLETAARKFIWCAVFIPNQVCDASKEHTSGLVIAGQLAA